ncbi:DUF4058 family protein [Chloroflexi bacterium TSY]|nr:DUF4058 family protein [Chloroflexi bacterium TSY]
MQSPFPGMDPYLEDRELWRSFHHNLATEIARQLNPLIVPKYFADVEVHTVLREVGISMETHSQYPDTSIYEVQPDATTIGASSVALLDAPMERVVEIPEPEKIRTVKVFEAASKSLVTSVEILSPVNKIGEGLQEYRTKRSRLMRSDVHLIEIDLLRRGTRPGPELEMPPLETDYVVLVNRADSNIRRISKIWPVALNQSLPAIPVPLVDPDPDVVLDLANVLRSIQADFYYPQRIDYTQPIPPPKLRPAMQEWWMKKIL